MAVKFEAKLPRQIPKSVNVYAVQKPRVSTSSLVALAQSFGLTGSMKDFITSADSIGYQENRFQIEVNRTSGAIRYRHLDKYGRQAEKTFDLSDQRVIALARKFLNQSKLFDLASARMSRVTHLRGAAADSKTRKIQETVIDAGVVYRRLVDGLTVTGPGGLAIVNVGADSDITGMSSIWRTLGKKKASVKVKSPDEVLEAFQKEASGWMGDTTVIKAEFGYFEHGNLDPQSVIEPVYAFVYVLQAGDVARKSAYVVAAGDRGFAPLMGKKRFPTAQTRRPKPK